MAKQGTSQVPEDTEAKVDYHYVCFARSHQNRHLYELDSDRRGPTDTGIVLETDDVLVSEGLDLVRECIRREGKDGNFGLLALGYDNSVWY